MKGKDDEPEPDTRTIDLFEEKKEPLAPFQRHSETSRLAAIAIHGTKITKRKEVLDFILSRGADGATDDEIQVALKMNPSTQRPRRIELVDDLRVEKLMLTRRTRGGRDASVWCAREFAP